MPVAIPLTHGAFTLVDEADAALANMHKWQLWSYRGHSYARASVKIGEHRRGTALHRLILNAPPDTSVDHIDGDGLNNQRSNLRLVSRGQNRSNSIKRAEAACSFKGVARKDQKWAAQISAREHFPVSPWYIGTFDTQVDAARAYDAVARILFGAHARVNFPRKGEQPAVTIAVSEFPIPIDPSDARAAALFEEPAP